MVVQQGQGKVVRSLSTKEYPVARSVIIQRGRALGLPWAAITLGGIWFGFRNEPLDFDTDFHESDTQYFGWWPADGGEGSVKLGEAFPFDYPEHLSKVRII